MMCFEEISFNLFFFTKPFVFRTFFWMILLLNPNFERVSIWFVYFVVIATFLHPDEYLVGGIPRLCDE